MKALRRTLTTCATALLLGPLSLTAHAGEATPMADNPVVEARLIAISEELRCLVCQNESLAVTPNSSLPNPMRQVAELTAPVLQIREADRDQTVGYGATASVKKGARLLTAGIGYADGLHRIAGNSELKAYVGEYVLPLLGRVSMDLTCWDASAVPAQVLESTRVVSLINRAQPVDKLAEICHTIGYEIFTRLGSRVQRRYE